MAGAEAEIMDKGGAGVRAEKNNFGSPTLYCSVCYFYIQTK